MEKKTIIANQRSSSNISKRAAVWDCGSSLYDSFELKSFERQLDAAICSRTLSMPHLSRLPPPTKKTSRSILKLIQSVFKPRNKKEFVDINWSGSLSSIPEGPEFGADIRFLGRRTASERFTDVGYIGVY